MEVRVSVREREWGKWIGDER